MVSQINAECGSALTKCMGLIMKFFTKTEMDKEKVLSWAPILHLAKPGATIY